MAPEHSCQHPTLGLLREGGTCCCLGDKDWELGVICCSLGMLCKKDFPLGRSNPFRQAVLYSTTCWSLQMKSTKETNFSPFAPMSVNSSRNRAWHTKSSSSKSTVLGNLMCVLSGVLIFKQGSHEWVLEERRISLHSVRHLEFCPPERGGSRMLQERLAPPVYSGGAGNSSATNALGRFSGVCQRNTLGKCLLSTLAGSQGAGLCCCTPPLKASPYPSIPAR